MRVLSVLLLVGVFVGAGQTLPLIPAATVLAEVQAQEPATITVYITKTGEKYHRDGCRHLSRSKIAITLKAAIERGFGPCSVCKPPTVAR